VIDLVVRGICCLRPGVPGISDRIQVRSIVGRFLEHSRLYGFHNGGDDEMYLGSADLMERNLDRRVEVLVPVLDAGLRRHLRDVVLQSYLEDSERAMLLQASGDYRRAPRREPSSSAQAQLLRHYTERPD
jgi:polyphosphate kinase